ncbi:MAG: sialidase family protein [Candidatus Thermoplasmatota archaeon]
MRLTPIVLVALSLLAGCFGGEDGTSDPVQDEPVSGLSADADLTTYAPFSLQLCDQGYRLVQVAMQATAASADRSCDFRVTKPLEDPTRFDWQGQHGPGNEVSMAVDPNSPLTLAGGAKDYTVSYISDTADCGEYTVWNGHFWSHDGGRTWANDLVPGFVGDPRPSPLKGNLCNTDPVSVFDSDGTYWHNGLNYRGAREDVGDPITPTGDGGVLTGSQIFFARSTDGAQTFDRITFASYGQNDPGIFNDKNWVAVDPDSDHMIHTWTNFYAAAPLIMYVESFDAGATWSQPVPLTPGPSIPGITGGQAGLAAPTGQFSMPQYDADGDVWVIWSAAGGVAITRGDRHRDLIEQDERVATVFEPARIAVTPGGMGGTGCLTKADFRTSVYPVFAVDTYGADHRNRKYLAWPAAGVTGTGIWVSHSDDALTWTAPVEVTKDLPEDQFMSWIDVDPFGTVHVAYYDCSVDVGGTNMTMGYTYSLDGGDTWAPNVWVGQIPFDGDLGHHQSGVPFIGDYIAVDASCQAVHFFWADTRHGRSDVYAATLLRDPLAMNAYAPELGSGGVSCDYDGP